MEKIQCEYCNKIICKNKLIRHHNSKECRRKQQNLNIILELKEYKCKHCDKNFNRLDKKIEHENNVSCDSKDLLSKLKEKDKELELIKSQNYKEINIYKEENNFLKTQLQIYRPNIHYNTNNNTNDYSTNNTNNITINNFNLDFNQIQDHMHLFDIHVLSDHNNIINFLMNIYKNKIKLTNDCKKVITYYINDKLINDHKCKVFLSNCANQLSYKSDILCQDGKRDKLLNDNIIKNACENNIIINRITSENGIKGGVRTEKITNMVNEVVRILKECGLVELKGL